MAVGYLYALYHYHISIHCYNPILFLVLLIVEYVKKTKLYSIVMIMRKKETMDMTLIP